VFFFYFKIKWLLLNFPFRLRFVYFGSLGGFGRVLDRNFFFLAHFYENDLFSFASSLNEWVEDCCLALLFDGGCYWTEVEQAADTIPFVWSDLRDHLIEVKEVLPLEKIWISELGNLQNEEQYYFVYCLYLNREWQYNFLEISNKDCFLQEVLKTWKPSDYSDFCKSCQ